MSLIRCFKYVIAFYFSRSVGFCGPVAEKPRKVVCLNMIVKDESDVIETCLESVKRMIDYWVIVDTGSRDNTKEIIKKTLKGIPGELHERPWVSFVHNRNEALKLAKGKGDYTLFIDADEVLVYSDDFIRPDLDKDFFYMTVRQMNAVDFKRAALVNNQLSWEWKGVLHECIECPQAKTSSMLQGVLNLCDFGPRSGRSKGMSDEEKYAKDAFVLESALKNEPDNSRYMFYLGQSYLCAKKYDLAKQSFQKRVLMKSLDHEETYRAMYSIGLCEELLDDNTSAIESFFKAYAYRNHRAEPLFRIAVMYRKNGNYLLSYLLSKFALSIPFPGNDACIEYNTYGYNLLIEFANAALLLGKWEEGLTACADLLANPDLPSDMRDRVISNYNLAKARLQTVVKD